MVRLQLLACAACALLTLCLESAAALPYVTNISGCLCAQLWHWLHNVSGEYCCYVPAL